MNKCSLHVFKVGGNIDVFLSHNKSLELPHKQLGDCCPAVVDSDSHSSSSAYLMTSHYNSSLRK